jgi:hypothetical protein
VNLGIPSLRPSDMTLYALILASLAIVVGIVLSQTDRRARLHTPRARLRGLLATSVEDGTFPESLAKLFASLLQDADACRKSHINMPAVAFFYMAVDTLAFLLDTNDPPSSKENAFSAWIARFLNPEGVDYVYPGRQLYVARCRLLAPGRTRTMRADGVPILYSGHGHHVLGDEPKAEVQIISVPELMRDFESAILRVVAAMQHDEQLLERAASRWANLGGLRDLVGLTQ